MTQPTGVRARWYGPRRRGESCSKTVWRACSAISSRISGLPAGAAASIVDGARRVRVYAGPWGRLRIAVTARELRLDRAWGWGQIGYGVGLSFRELAVVVGAMGAWMKARRRCAAFELSVAGLAPGRSRPHRIYHPAGATEDAYEMWRDFEGQETRRTSDLDVQGRHSAASAGLVLVARMTARRAAARPRSPTGRGLAAIER